MLRTKKTNRRDNTTTIATWNLNGRLKEPTRQEELFADMRGKRVDIAALQETMWNQDATITSKEGAMIINFKINAEGYRGLAYYLSPQWASRLKSTRVVNNRIVVARFKAFNSEKADLAVINTYGPTMMRTRENPEFTEEYYQHLSNTYNQEKKGMVSTFILGDLNSKIGKQQPDDIAYMGQYGKGARNENGDMLRSFLQENGLYLVNTHFKHRDRNIATWHKERIHNQIDYIIVPRYMIGMFTDAKSTTMMML